TWLPQDGVRTLLGMAMQPSWLAGFSGRNTGGAAQGRMREGARRANRYGTISKACPTQDPVDQCVSKRSDIDAKQ
ncbi:MAG TPA: hypothetical protein VFE56_12830, partial [Candidatus Binataceae bacterium]|nr:hypothetical protein [Candidatus Binataceae bacterium]